MKTFASQPQTESDASLPPLLWPLLPGGSSTATSHGVRDPVLSPRLVPSPSGRCLLRDTKPIRLLLKSSFVQLFCRQSSHQCCPFPAGQAVVPAGLRGRCLSPQLLGGGPASARVSGTWGIGYGPIRLGCDTSLNLRQSHSRAGAACACPQVFGSSSCPWALLGVRGLVRRQRFTSPLLVFGLESKCAPKYPRASRRQMHSKVLGLTASPFHSAGIPLVSSTKIAAIWGCL